METIRRIASVFASPAQLAKFHIDIASLVFFAVVVTIIFVWARKQIVSKKIEDAKSAFGVIGLALLGFAIYFVAGSQQGLSPYDAHLFIERTARQGLSFQPSERVAITWPWMLALVSPDIGLAKYHLWNAFYNLSSGMLMYALMRELFGIKFWVESLAIAALFMTMPIDRSTLHITCIVLHFCMVSVLGGALILLKASHHQELRRTLLWSAAAIFVMLPGVTTYEASFAPVLSLAPIILLLHPRPWGRGPIITSIAVFLPFIAYFVNRYLVLSLMDFDAPAITINHSFVYLSKQLYLTLFALFIKAWIALIQMSLVSWVGALVIVSTCLLLIPMTIFLQKHRRSHVSIKHMIFLLILTVAYAFIFLPFDSYPAGSLSRANYFTGLAFFPLFIFILRWLFNKLSNSPLANAAYIATIGALILASAGNKLSIAATDTKNWQIEKAYWQKLIDDDPLVTAQTTFIFIDPPATMLPHDKDLWDLHMSLWLSGIYPDQNVAGFVVSSNEWQEAQKSMRLEERLSYLDRKSNLGPYDFSETARHLYKLKEFARAPIALANRPLVIVEHGNFTPLAIDSSIDRLHADSPFVRQVFALKNLGPKS